MDASLENLRYSNNALNQMNRKNVKGYHAQKRKDGTFTGKYCSGIRIGKKKTHLGTFATEEEAAKRYREAVTDAFVVLEY